jgi:hypothetical protein
MLKRLLTALLVTAALPGFGAAQVQQGELAETSVGKIDLTVTFRTGERETGIYVFRPDAFSWSQEDVAERIAAGISDLDSNNTALCIYIEDGGTFTARVEIGAFEAPGLPSVPVGFSLVQPLIPDSFPQVEFEGSTQRQRESFFQQGFTAANNFNCYGLSGIVEQSHILSVTPQTPTQAGVYTSSVTLTVIPD